ncbi:sigma-70 family RNA polymerase sigma factor, partial [bacterium]|nr:sigma-70 family RNA polymerase sigma factor [bacterium]
MAPTDRRLIRLVERARRGDVGAFGKLYDEYADRIFGFARARGLSVQDAEDITATVFLKTWESIGTYDDRGIPFAAWLFRIARNAIVDLHRRSSRMPVPVEDPEPTGVVDGPETLALMHADAERLRQAIRQLTEDQASVIALRYWWDMSLKDTATTLDKNENSIKALQH